MWISSSLDYVDENVENYCKGSTMRKQKYLLFNKVEIKGISPGQIYRSLNN